MTLGTFIRFSPEAKVRVNIHPDLPKSDGTPGEQYIVRFPNNYGASIIQNGMSYGNKQGLWELGVLHYSDNDKDEDATNVPLCYRTPITDDVIGYLDPEKINQHLMQIEALPKFDFCAHNHPSLDDMWYDDEEIN